MEKILVVGATGLIGKALVRQLSSSQKFEVYGTYYMNCPSEDARYYKLDMDDLSDIKNILHSIEPQIVVSCLRGDFTKQLQVHNFIAGYLKETGGMLYYCSTANVFDNDLSRPHCESDSVNAISEYGQFKIDCERIIDQKLGAHLCIMRLPQVWGRESIRMKSLIESIKHDREITVYPDLEINTITDIQLARQIVFLIENRSTRIFHFGSQDKMSHKAFYMRLIAKLTNRKVCIKDNIEEVGIFSLQTQRSHEVPENFRFTNDDVINYLTDGSSSFM